MGSLTYQPQLVNCRISDPSTGAGFGVKGEVESCVLKVLGVQEAQIEWHDPSNKKCELDLHLFRSWKMSSVFLVQSLHEGHFLKYQVMAD